MSEPPAGLRFDVSSGVLSGVPRAGGKLELTARAGGREQRYEVELELRDSCWFAVLSRAEAGAPPQLHLRDVFATQDLVLGAGEPVSDFAFSPDGAWLAFRAGSSAQRLFVLAIPADPGSAAPPLPLGLDCGSGSLECSVQEYAWSPDSQRLALALRSGEGRDALAVVDVASGISSAPLFDVDWAGARLPLRLGGQLTWGGVDWFGCWGLEADVPAEESQVFHLVTLEGGRPATPGALLAEFGAGPELRAIPGGLALSYADSTIITSLGWSSEGGVSLRRTVGVLAPSGRLVGRASDEGRLQLIELSAAEEAAPVESERDACSAIVAWSERVQPGVERILCTRGTSLRLFDHVAAPAGAGAARLEDAAGKELGAAPDLLGTRRMFSASGRFLLLADASTRQLSLYDLLLGSPPYGGLPFELPAVAEFAPARDALVLADGESLVEYGLPRSLAVQRSYSSSGITGPALGARCSESYWQAPERWCGAPGVTAHWRYSPRAQSLLLEGPPGTLSLADVSVLPQRAARPLAGTVEPCAGPCRNPSYAFLPAAAPGTD